MAFDSEMRSLERNIEHGAISRSSAIMAALKDLPPGIIKCTDEGRTCEFIPHDAATAQPTRSKSARVAHLQRRALTMLVLSGDGALVTRAQPVVDEHEASEYVYIPADFNPPR
jgi:hypothetical protein